MNMKSMMTIAVVVLALPLHAAQTGSMTVSWIGPDVVVSGVTPRGQVSLIVAMHSRDEYRGRFFQANEQLADEDGDGVIRFQTPGDEALSSVVVAIDEKTGEYAAGSRQGAAPLMSESAYSVERDKTGHGVEVHLEAHYANAVVVRPGRGSWRGSIEAAGRRAGEGQFPPGMYIPVAKLQRRAGGTPAPDALEPNDLFVVVDQEPLQVLIYRETARP